MGAQGIFPALAVGQKEVTLAFRFTGIGATLGLLPYNPAAQLAASNRVVGDGLVSVNHTVSPGRYVVTLLEAWAALEAWSYAYQDTNYLTVATRKPMILVTETVSTTRQLVFAVEDGAGAASDLTATQTMHVLLTLRNVSPVT